MIPSVIRCINSRHQPYIWLSVLLLLGVTVACADLPVGTVGGNTALYQDAFIPAQTGNWFLEGDDLGGSGIVNEQLVINVKTPNTVQFATLRDQTFSDFVLEVDAHQNSGTPDSSYGVLFRMQDNDQFYRFEITGDGHFILERRNADGTWTRLSSDWTTSAAINQGLNAVNRLKVIASGSLITVYANDVLLQEATDATYASGTIGLDAGTFGDSNLQVSFDNLAIYGSEAAQ